MIFSFVSLILIKSMYIIPFGCNSHTYIISDPLRIVYP